MEVVHSVITWALGVIEDRTKLLVYFNKPNQPRLCCYVSQWSLVLKFFERLGF